MTDKFLEGKKFFLTNNEKDSLEKKTVLSKCLINDKNVLK